MTAPPGPTSSAPRTGRWSLTVTWTTVTSAPGTKRATAVSGAWPTPLEGPPLMQAVTAAAARRAIALSIMALPRLAVMAWLLAILLDVEGEVRPHLLLQLLIDLAQQ